MIQINSQDGKRAISNFINLLPFQNESGKDRVISQENISVETVYEGSKAAWMNCINKLINSIIDMEDWGQIGIMRDIPIEGMVE